MSEEKTRRDWVFPLMMPAEICLGISGVQFKYKISKAHAILLMITEGLFKEGLISQLDYEKLKRQYLKQLTEVVKREIPEEVETIEAKPSKIKESKPKKTIDYSKLSDDELLEAYRNAIISNDVIKPQLIQGEARRRGYRFRAYDDGNVQIISLKGEVQNE